MNSRREPRSRNPEFSREPSAPSSEVAGSHRASPAETATWEQVRAVSEAMRQSWTVTPRRAPETAIPETPEAAETLRIAEEALRALIDASQRLVGLLDELASQYETPQAQQPHPTYVALNQAAAAAEDLAESAQTTLRTLEASE